MDADDPSYADAMLEVLERIADVEQRAIDAVFGDLLWPDADTVRVRVNSRDAEGGQLSLAADVELREGIRRALLASACSVVNPARYHPRLSRSEADALLSACRAGQTERGSYVVKIICPLHAVEIPDEHAQPFTRRVTTYLMRSTARLVEDIERNQLDRYESTSSDAAPLSWNLCDALLRMRPERENGEVELSTHWAADPRYLPPRPSEVPSQVGIKADYFQEIEQVARVLRPSASEVREQQLIGTVEQLSGAVGDDGRRAGEVQFTLLKDNEQLRARATLDAVQYAIAMQAHERGDAYVILRGVLHRGPRLSRVEPVRLIELLDTD